METLNNYILDLLTKGKYFFTKQEALSHLGLTPNQFKFQDYSFSIIFFISSEL